MIDQIPPAQLNDWMAAKSSAGTTLVLDVREAWDANGQRQTQWF